jgi:hypothetical protein
MNVSISTGGRIAFFRFFTFKDSVQRGRLTKPTPLPGLRNLKYAAPRWSEARPRYNSTRGPIGPHGGQSSKK